MWIRILVTGGLVGPSGWEDHYIDLDKIAEDQRRELEKAIKDAKLSQNANTSMSRGDTNLKDGKQYVFHLSEPSGRTEILVAQENMTKKLRTLVNIVRKIHLRD